MGLSGKNGLVKDAVFVQPTIKNDSIIKYKMFFILSPDHRSIYPLMEIVPSTFPPIEKVPSV